MPIYLKTPHHHLLLLPASRSVPHTHTQRLDSPKKMSNCTTLHKLYMRCLTLQIFMRVIKTGLQFPPTAITATWGEGEKKTSTAANSHLNKWNSKLWQCKNDLRTLRDINRNMVEKLSGESKSCSTHSKFGKYLHFTGIKYRYTQEVFLGAWKCRVRHHTAILDCTERA